MKRENKIESTVNDLDKCLILTHVITLSLTYILYEDDC